MGAKQNLSAGYLVNDRYQIVRCVGVGSVGQVYHARDLHLDKQDIALKLLHPHLIAEKSVLKRFHNEVFISRKLINPNIVRVYDFESWEGGHLLSMEYVSGCDLAEICDGYSSGKLPPEEANYIMAQVADGLSCAHQNDVVHRDLKPQNVLIDRAGVARITDFGLAFSLVNSLALTQTGEVIGSPAYLAPEQFMQSEASPLSDIYSFGVLFFELLTGELPFRSNSFYGLGEAHRSQAFPKEKLKALQIREKLSALICACCEKDPGNRPGGMDEVLDALAAARGETVDDLADGLKTLVHYRRRDARVIHSVRKARGLYTSAFLLLAFLAYLILQDRNPQSRMIADLHKIEYVTGYSTRSIRELIPANVEIDIDDDDALKNLIRPEMASTLEMMIQANKDVLRKFKDGTGDTLVHHSARIPLQHYVLLLRKAWDTGVIYQTNNAGDTPIHVALKAGNIGGFKFMMQLLGVRLHDRDGKGDTPLHIATASGSEEAVRMILNSDKNILRDAINHEGLNALHLAVRSGNAETLRLLLRAGIQVDLRDSNGLTPLMRALSLTESAESRKLVHLLLRRGASLEARANDGRDVFAFADASGRGRELRWFAKKQGLKQEEQE